MAARRADPGHHHPLADLSLGAARVRFERIASGGDRERLARRLAVETPIALEIDGIGYAVMMATPSELEDFATGFCLSERLVDTASQIEDVEAHATADGVLLRVSIDASVSGRVHDRVRHRVSDSSCGLCGIENLEQALRPLPCVPQTEPVDPASVFVALAALPRHQPLSRETGAVHAAAACAPDGTIRVAREDVGRHNAFDKLVGAMARGGMGWDAGFALVTSRLSYEIVEKAALSGCPTIAAISAPTALAVERARAASIRVFGLVRDDALLEALPPR